MRKSFWITLAVVVCAAAAFGVAVGANGGRNDKTFEYAVGLWGDVPYSAAQEAVIPNLLADMYDVQWLKALVDPSSRDVFAFQAQMVPANIVAH